MRIGRVGSSVGRRVSDGGGRRRKGLVLLGVPIAAVIAIVLSATMASGDPYAATASVAPNVEYLNDTVGTTYTFTVTNTGTTESIGAVEITRPNNLWSVTGCPGAPVGWTTQTSDTKCRYRSATGEADDLQPGQSSSAFKLTATTPPGTQNTSGVFVVVVSKSDHFDNPSLLTVADSAGLTITIHSFQVTDAVVSDAPVAAGSACPPSDKDALRNAVVTMVVCGRNRTSATLTPNAANSSISGSFIAAPGTFSSGAIPSMSATAAPVVLGSWSGAQVTNTAGSNHTVTVVIGSASNQNSPATTFTGYEAINQAPVANDDTATATEDAAVDIDVLANDTDAENDTLSVGSVDTTGTVGTVTNNGDDVTYDPNGQFEYLGVGETAADSFTYTANDGFGNSNSATVNVTITGVNDNPVANDDTDSANENGPSVTIAVLGNDTDVEDDTLSVSAVDTTGTLGTVTNNGTDVSYNPNGQFESLDDGETATDSFTYTASDGNGGSDTATVIVVITGSNDAPVAVDDAPTTSEDSSVVVDVLANDVDPDSSDSLTVSAVDTTGTAGTVTNNGGNVTYDPNGQFEGLAIGETATDSFTYTASDGDATDTATVIVTVTGVNDAPDAVDDTATVADSASATVINVLGNDTDPDFSDVLTVSAVDTTGTQGIVTNNGTNVSYDPNGQFDLGEGETATDTFTYTASDGNGGTDTATVQVTIEGTNDAPVATDDSFAGAIGNTKFSVGVTTTGEPAVNVSGNLLTNDTDADGDTLTTSLVSVLNESEVTVNADGSFTYVSPAGFTGVDGFTYSVSDGTASDTANVSITVADMVWYVDDSVDNGNGTSIDPYSSLAPLQGIDLDEAGETIFVYSGSYTGGIVLEANQDLLGEPNGLVVNGHTLVTAGGSNPTIANAAGAGITLASGVDVQRVDVSGTSGDGVTGSSISSATVGSNTAISNAAGAAVALNGGSGNVFIGSTITNSAGRSIDVQNRTGGGVSLTGSVNDTGAGIFLGSNAGSTINLSGGLTLSTGANPAFSASGGGTITVTGSNSATTTTAAAVAIANTTIGSSGVTFDSVSSSGAVNGIFVANSGTTGKLSVNGGTIAGSTSHGVSVTGTARVALTTVTVSGSVLDAVNVGAASGTPSVLVDNSTLTSSGSDGVEATVSGSSSLNLTVKDSDVLSSTGLGVTATATGVANLNASVTGNTLTNQRNTDVNVVGAVNSTVHATITSNTITHPAPVGGSHIGFGIRVSQEEDGDFTARIENNSTAGTGFGGIKALSRLGNLNTSAGTSAGDTGTLHATIRSNTVSAPANTDFGIEATASNAENAICAVITGNTATGGGLGAGIRARQASTSTYSIEGLLAGAQTATVTATYLNTNNISVPLATAAATTNFTGVAAGTCRTATATPQP